MLKFGLIGNPISHSKSPALFKAAYPSQEFSYNLIEAPTCAQAMELFNSLEYKGINITSPFKEDIMQYITLPDRVTSLMGCANIAIKEDGELKSYNSDYYGVKLTLEEVLSGKENLKAMVIGAGGAGKAAALACVDLGMETFLANRSASKAAPYAEKIGAKYISLDQIPLYIGNIDLIVYSLSFKIETLKPQSIRGKIIFEANYANPQFSTLEGIEYISGKYWLYNQAVPAFKLFTGENPDTKAMREIMGL
ncbi:MAG: hypothetical protein Q4B21_03670 [Bacteroidia bacterium]|nr:hypothetical protein [Bacteroidia bacterium]